MTVDTQPGDLLDALGRLSPATPRASRDDATRARCHAALAQQRRRRRGRLLDAVLGAMAALYAVAVVAEGLRMLFR